MGQIPVGTTYKKYSKSDYITSEDIGPKDVVVTILRVEEEQVKNADDKKGTLKAVLITAEFKKPIVLNATNYKRIKSMYKEPDLSKWKDYKVTLYVEKGIVAFGDIVDGIRVRSSIPKEKVLPVLLANSASWQSYVDYMQSGGSIEEVKKNVSLSAETEKALLSCLKKH